MTPDFIPRSLEELALEWPPELDHISASSVKMMVRCPEQWRQRYVLGKKIPPAAALIYGRADHAAIELSMQQKIHSYVDLPVGDVKEKFIAVVDEEIEREGGYAELDVRDGKEVVKAIPKKKQLVGEAKRLGQNLVAQYQQQVSPDVQPLEVEKAIEIHTRLPVKITGYIDLIADCPPGGLARGETADGAGLKGNSLAASSRIIDRKRVSRYGVQAEWRLAADVYQLAYPVPHEWHLSNTSSGGRVHTPDTPDSELVQPVPNQERALLFLEQTIAQVGFLYRRYGPDHPWPTQGKLHPFACSYCGFRPGCWGWQ